MHTETDDRRPAVLRPSRVMPPRVRERLRRAAILPLAAAVLLGLSGCVPWPFGSADADTASTSGRTTSSVCSYKQNLTLDGSNRRFIVGGPCGDLSIRGTSLTVRLESATSVTIEGRSITVKAVDNLGSLTVRGTNSAVTAQKIGAVSVNGEHTIVHAVSVGAVRLLGEDNSVLVQRKPESYVQSGENNQVIIR